MGAAYGVNVIGRMFLRGSASAVRQAIRARVEAGNTLENAQKIQALMQQNQSESLATGINLLSLLQLTRFIAQDIHDLSSGTGGLGDVLSIATSVIIALFRIQQLQREAELRQLALNVLAAQGVAAPGIAALPVLAGGWPAIIALTAVGFTIGVLEAISKSAKRDEGKKERLKMESLEWGTVVG